MYWFRRPPYLRWAAGAAVLAFAAVIELAPRTTEARPFAVTDLGPGHELVESDIEWRQVEKGLLPLPDLAGVTAVSLGAGEPILASSLTKTDLVPASWWSVPVRLPEGVLVGTPVKLIVTDTGHEADGMISVPPSDDPFAIDPTGLVAVPEADAGRIAAAETRRTLTILVGGARR
ncbi:MAG: SAF domain-containing protein [Acidimicrobiia bacterium]|nr:SAF domain-containing protein [Acidimicrobiia bacterium]